MEKELWPGWKAVGKLGSGGFGSVYRIEKSDLSGTVQAALKVISIPNSPDDYDTYVNSGYDEESVTAMFRSQLDDIVKEFRLMSELEGISNIVSYQDHRIVEHEDGRGWDIYIKMELLTALPQYYKDHPMDETEVIRLGKDICTALELCESKNIIHRDIKPQNIFVNNHGNFKLGDFGIARTMEHTVTATKTGTYAYMAPEVYAGKAYNANVDLYSLGLVLYWLLNERRLPFEPLGSMMPTAAVRDEAQSRRLRGERFPDTANGSSSINSVIRKCCAADPKERYQTAVELRQALEEVLYDDSDSTKGVFRHGYRCMKCGAPVMTPNTICASCQAEARPKKEFFCKSCGKPIAEEDSYCPECQQEMLQKTQKTEYHCKTCGKPVAQENTECPECQEKKKKRTMIIILCLAGAAFVIGLSLFLASALNARREKDEIKRLELEEKENEQILMAESSPASTPEPTATEYDPQIIVQAINSTDEKSGYLPISAIAPCAVSKSGGLVFYPYGHDNADRWYGNSIGGETADEENWFEYALDGSYSSLSGTAYLNYDYRDKTAKSAEIKIYGDDRLLFASGVLSAEVMPQDFSIDMTGIASLRISIFGDSYARISDLYLTSSQLKANESQEYLFAEPYNQPIQRFENIGFAYAYASTELYYAKLNKTYYASNAIDGDVKTCWQEDADNNGEGEFLVLGFDEEVELNLLSVRTGYSLNEDVYYRNSRPKTVQLSFSDGSGCIFRFQDLNANQVILLSKTVRTEYVRITILDVYEGSEYTDNCISEVTAYS